MSLPALKISGRQGRHSLINETFEPMQVQHNKHPIWVARAVAPRYLFHTGKSRWCISKQQDDGHRCWAYIQDSGNSSDPSQCTGAWQCVDDNGTWAADNGVKCTTVQPANDMFVKLRMTLDGDMRKYGLVESSDLKCLWKRLDYNGNNVVSLAEIDKMAVELVSGGTWPAFMNNKPALMRAYKKTILVDGDGDAWVEKPEFHALLLNLFWFGKLFEIFRSIDTGADRRIDMREFSSGMSMLGLNLSQQEAQAEFQKIDVNGGGQVLFVEFCAYIRTRVNPDANATFDADIVSGEHCGKNIRAKHGHAATRDLVIQRKSVSQFDELEKKILGSMQDKKKLRAMWKSLDFNGNNIVSLAEIDKWVVEQYPLLNHKPALMRAYKRTIKEGNDDSWVQKKEFKALLASLFYFNKIFWIFNEVDGDDRRLDFDEFRKCLSFCGTNMSEDQARREFQSVDRNGGGIILFDEFCRYFTMKSCPQSMVGMIDE